MLGENLKVDTAKTSRYDKFCHGRFDFDCEAAASELGAG